MTQHLRRGSGLSLAALLMGALVAPSCGGSSTGGGPTDGTGQPTRSTISEHSWALDPLQIFIADLNVTGTGSATLDATAEWTFASDDVDLFVTAQACTEEMFIGDRCAFKTKADSATAKPERVSFSVSANDTYRFWIVNFGPQRESGTFVATLTR